MRTLTQPKMKRGATVLIVIVETVVDEVTQESRRMVSHAIDSDTDQVLPLPPGSPEEIGARFDDAIGEYVLPDPGVPQAQRPRRG